MNFGTPRTWFAPLLAAILFMGIVAFAVSNEKGNASEAQATDIAGTTTLPLVLAEASTTAVPVATSPATTVPTTTIPTTTTTSVPVYSRENPRPLPKKTGKGKRIVYANLDNWVWIIDENEQIVLSVPVSGRKFVPKPRHYRVFGKGEFSQSIFFPEIKMKWSTRFAISPNGKNTIAFHEIPTCAWTGGHCNKKGLMQTEEQLGTFQRGGCIRMASRDAEFLFHFADIGTKVVVLA